MLTRIDASAAPDASGWPRRFAAARGRAPRALLIGNYANLAYQSAKLQRAAGVEAYVLDPDSYHIMASPEWLEADVKGDWGDDFNPVWARVDLGGWRRPDWFTQGQRNLAFARVGAQARGEAGEAAALGERIAAAARIRGRALGGGGEFGRILAALGPLGALARRLGKRAVYGREGQTPAAAGEPIVIDGETGPAQMQELAPIAPLLRQALAPFDFIEGFGLGARFGLAAGHPRVIATETGTLRALPFEDNETGRLCSFVYRHAHATRVTNSDCLAPARRLGLAESRLFPALHPFDPREPAATEEDAGLADGAPLFVAPARHHWRQGTLTHLKGNDVIIEAAARLAAAGRDFRLLLFEWGFDAAATKALIAERGLCARVLWRPPASRPRLWSLYRLATGVIDQFVAPALGTAAIEALTLGKRLLTRYDAVQGAPFFRNPPPLMNCDDPEALRAAMAACLDDPGDRAGLGARARAWALDEHGVERQLRDQFALYEAMT